MEKVYGCKQVADRYKVKVSTVWEWIRDKRLPAVKIGKSYVVKETDLLSFEKAGKTITQ